MVNGLWFILGIIEVYFQIWYRYLTTTTPIPFLFPIIKIIDDPQVKIKSTLIIKKLTNQPPSSHIDVPFTTASSIFHTQLDTIGTESSDPFSTIAGSTCPKFPTFHQVSQVHVPLGTPPEHNINPDPAKVIEV
jgi:hypothetical protein